MNPQTACVSQLLYYLGSKLPKPWLLRFPTAVHFRSLHAATRRLPQLLSPPDRAAVFRLMSGAHLRARIQEVFIALGTTRGDESREGVVVGRCRGNKQPRRAVTPEALLTGDWRGTQTGKERENEEEGVRRTKACWRGARPKLFELSGSTSSTSNNNDTNDNNRS